MVMKSEKQDLFVLWGEAANSGTPAAVSDLSSPQTFTTNSAPGTPSSLAFAGCSAEVAARLQFVAESANQVDRRQHILVRSISVVH
jgi:hypothetical protein